MNKYTHLKSMKEGDRIWISPRSIEIKDDGNPKEGLLIDLDAVGQLQFSSYYSALVVKKRGDFLVFLTQTAINVYRTFRYRSFSRKVPGKVFLHPKVTFNAHALCEHYHISTHDSLSVIEILEETLFGTSGTEEQVAEKVSERLNQLFRGLKTFTSNLPFSSKPFYSISIMPTDFKMTDKFLAIDTMGFCHFKTLAELKQLKMQHLEVREASNG